MLDKKKDAWPVTPNFLNRNNLIILIEGFDLKHNIKTL